MRIGLISDVHFNMWDNKLELPTCECDVLIVAGDLDNGPVKAAEGLLRIAEQYKKPIVAVMGNHDCWGMTPADAYEIVYGLTNKGGIHLLNRSKLEIDGVVFGGTTLWYNPMDPNVQRFVSTAADFRFVARPGNSIALEWLADEEWLTRGDVDDIDVLVTHMFPFAESLHPQFAHSLSNVGFHRPLNPMSKVNPSLWVHGHTHCESQYNYRDIHVACNPRGNPGERYTTPTAPLVYLESTLMIKEGTNGES